MTGSRIYTKTGDDGTTGLLHGGRVSKGDQLVGAYGDIDEAVAALGAARAAGLEPRLAEIVLRVQRRTARSGTTMCRGLDRLAIGRGLGGSSAPGTGQGRGMPGACASHIIFF
ncbi:MAG: hypothetical protein ACRDPY_50045 [Streptosporangiaceae bacterium]